MTIHKVNPEDFWIYSKKKTNRSVYVPSIKDGKKTGDYQATSLQHPKAECVAFAKGPFGEGVERFAFRFFELASDAMTIVGKPWVAKENRLILEQDDSDEIARKKFVRTFCSTQQIARSFAERFNAKLASTYRVDSQTPRVAFLDCSIYELDDDNLGKLSVLVEEKLDHTKWQKWNANNGYVQGMKSAPKYSASDLRQAMLNMTQMDQFDMIEEGSDVDMEEEDSPDESDKEVQRPAIIFTPFEVAQAFSHFTYLASWRRRLVCDLQGVYDEERNMLLFSDPVIHYHNDDKYRKHVHGNTDHGKKGMAKFFDTHHEHCGHLCRLVNRGFRRTRRAYHQGKHQSAANGN